MAPGLTISMGRSVTARTVDEAARRLHGVVRTTPLERNVRLSALAGGEVWVKREDLQPVRSYKLRGAYNLMAQLKDPSAGVVCASAGNHAQGVAYACYALAIKGRVYLPRTTPHQKRERIASIGGAWIEIIVSGDTYDAAAADALADAQSTGAHIVPAFDDSRTIAGQGTVAREIIEQLGHAPDRIIVPVGGGGLLAGMATWLHERHPAVELIGVEPVGATSMAAALAAGGPVPLEELDTFVDGAAVRTVGAIPFAIVQRTGVRVVAVAAGAVCAEMLALYQTDGIIAEPAGALASSAVEQAIASMPGAVTVCILSGGNNDVSRYGEIIERALVHAHVKHYFLVDFPQEPGALRRFLDDVLGPDDDITLFEYIKRNSRETGAALVGIEIGKPDDLPGLLDRMAQSPLRIEPVDPASAAFRFLT
jgi:threonine dehydratase